MRCLRIVLYSHSIVVIEILDKTLVAELIMPSSFNEKLAAENTKKSAVDSGMRKSIYIPLGLVNMKRAVLDCYTKRLGRANVDNNDTAGGNNGSLFARETQSVTTVTVKSEEGEENRAVSAQFGKRKWRGQFVSDVRYIKVCS